ncbi:hypothetical protein [Embleya sp. NPDC059237]|uniref:hypothetical protein n=1 Tax=Embleya sp. NPDC059237 TaxID=3346784 RepID=UPI0036A2F582
MKPFRLRQRLAATEKKLRDLVTEHRACPHRLADAATRIRLLEAENAAITGENHRLKQHNAGLDTALRDCARRLDIVEAAHAGLTRDRNALAADLDTGIERIRVLEGQVTRLVRPRHPRPVDRTLRTIPGELVLTTAVAS